MATRKARRGAAAHTGAAAPSDSKEKQHVKIPVEDVTEDTSRASQQAKTAQEAPQASSEGSVAYTGNASEPMSEEEMIAAAIAAGEQAANEDFKAKYEAAAAELAELRAQMQGASTAQEAADAKLAEANDRLSRLQADWENYRRRTAKERLEESARATEKLIEVLLPVVDDIERAIEHARAQELDEVSEQFVDGVDAVHAKLMGIFEHEGVEAIDPAGEAFDPHIHQAVGRVEDAERYDETVNEVYQKGYRMAGKVLRPAMVTVTYGGEKRPEPTGEEGEVDEDVSG